MTNTTQPTTELKALRRQTMLNTYQFEGKQIERIIIFKDGEELHSFKWVGNNNNYPEIYFDDIKNRNKIDLNRKEVFYNSFKIYIHADICQFKELEESFDFETATYKRYRTAFSMLLNCSKDEPYLNELGQLRYKTLEPEQREVKDYFKHRNEETPDAQRLESISNKLEQITNKYISAESILQIEAFYNIKFNQPQI